MSLHHHSYSPTASRRAQHQADWPGRIVWFEPFWLLLCGGLLLVPGRFLPAILETLLVGARPWLVGALFLGWPLRWLAYGRLSRRTPLDWSLAFLLLWLPVNLLVSVDKVLSWESLSYLVFGITLYFALINWPPIQRHPDTLAWTVLFLGAGLVLAAPLLSQLTATKVFQVPFLNPFLVRLADTLPGNVNANRMAGAVVVLLPLYTALALRWDWHRQRWPWGLAVLLSGAALFTIFLTQSRGAYVATAAALAVLLVLRWPRLIIATPAVLAVGIFLFYRIGANTLFDQVGGDSALNSLEGRLELWSRALYAIQDFSFTGIGIGTFDVVIPLLYPLFLIAPDTKVSHAHQLFLQVGVDLGLPGLIAYLALHINVFVILWSALRHREWPSTWCLAAGTMAGFIAMFVHGLTDAPLWGAKPAFLPWLLVALAVLLRLRVERREAGRGQRRVRRKRRSVQDADPWSRALHELARGR